MLRRVAIGPSTIFLLLLLGVVVGLISGMVGIGGGVLVIPLLMLLLGMSQKEANGISLAMLLPPIGILAVMEYNRAGLIRWPVAIVLALGFVIGAPMGARLITKGWISETALRVTFALLLVYLAGRILFRTGGRARAALETLLLVIGFAAMYTAMRLLGRQWRKA